MPRIARSAGFGLIVYAVLALGILGTLAGIAYSIRKAGGDAVRAELEPKLQACAAEVERANEAALATKAEGDRRIAAASKGAARARQDAQGAVSEAQRLRAFIAAPPTAEACPAASATARVREGLK